MKIQAVTVDLEAFGAQFANMDDKDQAAFFRGLAGELKCWKSQYNAGMQFCSVGMILSKEQKELLSETVAMAFDKAE